MAVLQDFRVRRARNNGWVISVGGEYTGFAGEEYAYGDLHDMLVGIRDLCTDKPADAVAQSRSELGIGDEQ